MSQQHPLPNLDTHAAITDALYRGILGWDNYDHTMFDSAWAGEDVSINIDGTVHQGLSNIKKGLFAGIGPMDTQHIVSNVRVQHEGRSTAHVTSYFQAQHCPPGRGKDPDGPKYLVGGQYFVDLVRDQKDQGVWRIKKWDLKIVWTQGDPSVMPSRE